MSPQIEKEKEFKKSCTDLQNLIKNFEDVRDIKDALEKLIKKRIEIYDVKPVPEFYKKTIEQCKLFVETNLSFWKKLSEVVNKDTTENEGLSYIFNLFILFIIFYVVYTYNVEKPEITNWSQFRSGFVEEIKVHKNVNFPSQSHSTFGHLISAVHSTMSDATPRQPSCILLLSPPDISPDFGSCFSKKMAGSVITAYGLEESVQYYSHNYFQSGITVSEIHEDFKDSLERSKIIVVNDLQLIQDYNQLLIFHSFCDNYTPTENRAIFLFPIPVSQEVWESYRGDWDNDRAGIIAEKMLSKAWVNALSDEVRPAIIVRVAGTSVLLQKGDSC